LLLNLGFQTPVTGGRRIVKTTQLIRKKGVYSNIINYMFRPTVAIIRFITCDGKIVK